MDDFIKVSQQLGKNLLYVQGAGGNSSVKIGNKLYVKASGFKLKQVKKDSGYACIQYKPLKNFIIGKTKYSNKDEQAFLNLLRTEIIQLETFGKPSMEAGFHAVISSKFVIHLHSVYANIFNCMKYGPRIISNICKDMPHTIIDYKNPGYELAYVLSKKHSVSPLIFLKNHGVIVHGQNINVCLKQIEKLHGKIETYLKNNNAYKPFQISSKYKISRKFSFPDSAVFSNVNMKNLSDVKKKELLEINSAQQYVTETIKRLDGRPSYLTEKAINKLLTMEQEKHRLEIFNK